MTVGENWRRLRLTRSFRPQYSMYGHIKTLADAEVRGIKKAGGTVDVYQ